MNYVEAKPRGYFLNEKQFDQRKLSVNPYSSAYGMFSKAGAVSITAGNWSNVGSFENFITIFPGPKTYPVTQSLEKEFRSFADKWYQEISKEPSLARMTSKTSYLSVIGLEPKARVISLILKELQSKPAPWFLALQILSKNQEVGKEYAGNLKKIAEAWLKWGKENRYI
jgi:hypothetical protein